VANMIAITFEFRDFLYFVFVLHQYLGVLFAQCLSPCSDILTYLLESSAVLGKSAVSSIQSPRENKRVE